MQRRYLIGAALLAGGLVAPAHAVPAPASLVEDFNLHWPQWRGQAGHGIATGPYRDRWTATENVAWKAAIPGMGHSSPVVWGQSVYLTTAIEGAEIPGRTAPDHLGFDLKPGYLHPDSVGVDRAHRLEVLALDAATGKVRWSRVAYDGPMYDNRHRSNTYASASVVTDGQMVYASFESEGFYAYDVNGTLKWKQSFGGMAKAGLGPGTSPILFGDLVILQADLEMGAGSSILALDKQSGAIRWKTPRANRRSWATPIIVEAGGRKELIASGAEAVAAYDPVTGRELWRTEGTRSHPIPSVVTTHGLLFATAGSQAKVALAIRPGAQPEEQRIAWRHNKGTAYVTSPIAIGDHLYLVSDAGIMTCLDARTGAVVYEGGRVPVPATFRASPVAFGDRILLTSEDGDTFVIRAGPVHEVLHSNTIGEPVWASPALAGGTVFIRGARHLYAIR